MAPASPDSPMQRSRGMTWRGPVLVAGAVALGLLLFLLLWWSERDQSFYRAPPEPVAPSGQRFEALPAPLPGGESGNASGMGEADTATASSPHPPPPPRAPLPPSATAPAPAQAAASVAAASAPVPVVMPAPRYPPSALRNRESGTVLLRVEVGTDGVPTDVEVVRSSRTRALDRAAVDAVRGWRFRPAQRAGQPVPGSVQVPINFEPGG
ncbi:MAG TPA: energy transducer TonB [Xanthomonadaceae bacterium]|nr:energy transducer TonB [Xanthomonadaceae bacterium]